MPEQGTAATPAPKRTRTAKAERAPRQNHGAKLARCIQFVEIKLRVLEDLAGDSPSERLKGQIAELGAIQAMLNAKE